METVACCRGILSVIIFLLPPLYGEGYEIVNSSLRGDVPALFNGTLYENWQHNFLLVVLAFVLIIVLRPLQLP